MNTFFPNLLLIDGSYYLYRYYYGIPTIKNKYGQNINAIYGILNLIRRNLIIYKPDNIVIIFDNKEKTFRNKIFNKYKSNRNPMPQKLIKQIQPLYKIINVIGITLIIADKVEADDVIGTLSTQANKVNHSVLIFSGDKDMIQLVNNQTRIIYNKNYVYDIKYFIKKYGFLPKLIVDFIALCGDNIDNIPGIKGIGKKTAQILLKEIGNLKNIYSNLELIKLLPLKRNINIYQNLKKNKKLAFFCYKLALIKKNVKLEESYENLNFQYQSSLLKKIEKYSFKKYLINKNIFNFC